MADLNDYIRHSQPSEEGREAYRRELAAAEARGKQRMIDALRDSARYLAYHRDAQATGALPEAGRGVLLRIQLERAAAYLEQLAREEMSP